MRAAVVDHFTQAQEQVDEVRPSGVNLNFQVALKFNLICMYSQIAARRCSSSVNQIGARADAALQAMIAAHFLVREEVVVDEDAAAAAAAAAARCV